MRNTEALREGQAVLIDIRGGRQICGEIVSSSEAELEIRLAPGATRRVRTEDIEGSRTVA